MFYLCNVKTKKHKLFSVLFLFIFLSAFSTGAYASISNSIKEFSHSSLKKELKQDGTATPSENLVFEETENDREESADPIFTLLPAFLNFDAFTFVSKTIFHEFTSSEKAVGPIFLSIRSIRI